MHRSQLRTAVAVALLLAGPVARDPTVARGQEHPSRQTMIHERGALVMPFDLDRTVHVFQQTKKGGVQQVRAKDPNDTEQIRLIQEHLREEAQRFAQGDFGDPANLHGHDMPGLQVLRHSAEQLSVHYSDLPDGGEIVYQTNDPEVLDAVHEWFAAQLHDHGADATGSMMP